MGLQEFKDELSAEHIALADASFEHEIVNTKYAPDVDDPAITYPNFAEKKQKSKRLTSAVLFVDMRGSTAMSFANQDMTKLAPIYSAFIRSMGKCAHYYGGKVRNIIGDRVMVVFDQEKCYSNAIETAVLMNSVVQYQLKDRFEGITVKAGIGMDFGQMLVSKAGVIKQGDENDPNKALVWLGKPANVASKLTDLANKETQNGEATITEHHHYSAIQEFGHYDFSPETFVSRLTMKKGQLAHESEHCFSASYNGPRSTLSPPILMTQYFYDEFAKQNPDNAGVKGGWWRQQQLSIPGYPNAIYGGDVYKTVFKD